MFLLIIRNYTAIINCFLTQRVCMSKSLAKLILLCILCISAYAENDIINGYTLPPEPDPKINNSTLLGIDSNHNGVRDDVERWIYRTYSKPIERAVMMQSAKAYQIVIREPEKALKNLPIMQAATACISYWNLRAKREGEIFWLEKFRDYYSEINPVQFNTAKRLLAYEKYNHTLSGGVYTLIEPEDMKSKCDFNVTQLLEQEK